MLDIGIKEENIRFRKHSKEELVFYSKATTDIEFNYPFGWGELWGIADRTDYDLSRHSEHSKQDLSYLDPETNEKFIPYVIEPSVGVDRLLLAILCDAYELQQLGEGDSRVVLHISPKISKFNCDYDETGSIGKRYRREDEIGTPFCVTIDFDTLEDNQVTVRDRDTMEQVRIPIDEIEKYVGERIK